MRGTSHDATLRNDRKAELGTACPEIDHSTSAAQSLRTKLTYVRIRIRTAVPHQSSARTRREGIGGWVWEKRKIAIQSFAGRLE